MESKIITQTILFDCERLLDNNNYYLVKTRFKAIKDAEGITSYFKKQSIKDDKDNYCRNYVIKLKNTEQIIACFSLKAGAIPYVENIEKVTISKDSKLIPAIEIVNVAINEYFKNAVKQIDEKIGKVLYFSVIEEIIKSVASIIGVQTVYLFAANEKLANYYESWGFHKIEDLAYNSKLAQEWQNTYSQNCIFMYKPTTEIIN